MAGTVLTDGEDEPRVERPIRKIKPTAALLQHAEQVALPSQQKAVDNFCAAEAAKCAAERQKHLDALPQNISIGSTSSQFTSLNLNPSTSGSGGISNKTKRACVEEISDKEESDDKV
jgi:hypothetical protein